MKLPNFFSNNYIVGIALVAVGVALLLLFSGTLIIRVLGIVASILLINKGLQYNNKGSVFSCVKSWFDKLS
ncbi:hypothetical protein EBU24_03365 [bacterium]|nr:hypothetical protein [bacterium]